MNPNRKLDVLKTLLVFLESENIQFEIEIDEVNRKVIKIKDEFPSIYQSAIIYFVNDNKLCFTIENRVQIFGDKYQILKDFYNLYCKFLPITQWAANVSIGKNGNVIAWSVIHLDQIEELNIDRIEQHYYGTQFQYHSFFVGIREIYQLNKTAEEAMEEVHRNSKASTN